MNVSAPSKQTFRNPLDLREICLDANATTRPLDEVIGVVSAIMRGDGGNPSSAHWLGGIARTLLEGARDDVISLLPGTLPEGVIFTSGGTEANNAVLTPAGLDGRSITLITTAVEHPSVLQPAERFARMGGKVVILPISRDGMVEPDVLGKAVRNAVGTVLVSVQWANSETGVVQPIGHLTAEARGARPDVFFHSDVAQAIGRVRIDLEAQGVDVATFAGHKLHGPQGVGALVLRDPELKVAPFILGGGQERGMRSGTQNVAGAAGLGLAMRIRAAEFDTLVGRLSVMRETFEHAVLSLVPEARVNGVGPELRQTNRTSHPSSCDWRGTYKTNEAVILAQARRCATCPKHEQHPFPRHRGHGACREA